MTTILLHDYLDQTAHLLEDDQFEQAEKRCLQILEQFPRYLEPYRILAKSLLGQRKFDEAIELFQRILSADPNDFLSHIALSDSYRETAHAEESVWHLRRAFELQPYNKAIQEELLETYPQQDNPELELNRIPLTNEALAHQYLRGELYQQAASLIQTILMKSPDRIDLEILLAESLWRSGNQEEAAKVCQNVLTRLPNCVTANAILSQILLATNRATHASQYFQTLQSLTQQDQQHLDKDTVVGRAFLAQGAPVLPEEIRIDIVEIEETAQAAPTAEWVSEIPLDELPSSTGSDSEAQIDSEPVDMFGWLSGFTSELDGSKLPQSEESGSSESDESAVSEMDWFADQQVTGELTDPTASVTDWLGGEWQGKLGDAPEEFVQGDEPTKASAEADMVQSELPDWLSAVEDDGAVDEVGEEFESAAAFADRGDMPDWLSDVSGDELDAIELDPMTASQWLQDSPDESSVEDVEETAVSDILPTPETEGITNWLDELSTAEVISSEDDWFTSEPPESAESAESADSGSGLTDWLTDLGDVKVEEEFGIESKSWLTHESDNDPAMDMDKLEGESETWLTTDSDDNKPIDEADEMDWLAGLTGTDELGAESETWLMAETDAGSGSDDSKPIDEADKTDWLAGLAGTDELDEESETWLTAETDADSSSDANKPIGEADAMDWLAGLAGTDELEIEGEIELITESDAGSDDNKSNDMANPSDWLAGLAGTDELESDSEAWLTTESDSDFDDSTPDDMGDAVDWLEDLAETGDLEEDENEGQKKPEADVVSPSQSDLAESTEPSPVDWLSDLVDTGDLVDEDDWLIDLAQPTGLLSLDENDKNDELLTADVDKEADEVASAESKDQLAEAMPDWLDDTEDSQELEASLMGDSEEKKENDKPETEDQTSTDDLMDWLDDLSSEDDEELVAKDNIDSEGAADLLDLTTSDLPSWLGDAAPVDETAVPEETDIPIEKADLPEWLQNLAPEGVEQAMDETAVDHESATEFDSDIEKPTTGGLTQLLSEIEAATPAEESPAAETDWLSELTAAESSNPTESMDEMQDAGPDEMETAVESDSLEEILAADQFDSTDDSDWLSQLAVTESETSLLDFESDSDEEIDSGTGLDWMDELMSDIPDIPEIEAEPTVEEPTADELAEETFEDDADLSFLDVPADLDDAMSWLEDLAKEEDAPVESLPTIAAVLDDELLKTVSEKTVAEDQDSAESEVEELVIEELILAEPILEESSPVEIEAGADELLDGALAELDEAMSWLDDLDSVDEDIMSDEAEADEDDLLDLLDELSDPEIEPVETIETEEPTEFDDIPDEIMAATAWLDELTVTQDVQLDELPTLVEPDVELGQIDELAESVHTDSGLDLPADSAADQLLESIPDVPEDLDAAMAWLEELAAEQDAPLEELPSISASALPDIEVSDTLVTEEVEAKMPDSSTSSVGIDTDILDALDWLEGELDFGADSADVDEVTDVSETSDEDLAHVLDMLELMVVDSQMPDSSDSKEAQVDAESALADELLFQTLNAQSAAEEDSDQADDVFDIPDDPDAALAWLENLVEDDVSAETIEAPSTLVLPSPDEVDEDETLGDLELIGLEDLDDIFNMPDDQDAAMAWLEEIDDDAGADETAVSLPVADDPEPTGLEDLDDIFNMPDDQDAAMAWLEEIDDDAGANETAVSLPVADDPEPTGLEDLDDIFNMPDDQDAAMAWLEEVDDLDSSPPILDIDSAQKTEPTLDVDAEDFLSDVPEDPDEAMAWLEKLAAKQGASLDELPSVDEMPTEVETPDWVANAQKAAEAEESADTTEPELLLTEESVELESPISEQALLDEGIDEDIPDWLRLKNIDDDPDSELPPQTDWLDSLPQMDVTGWLESEAIASDSPQLGSTGPLPDTGPLFEESIKKIETSELQEPLPEETFISLPEEPEVGFIDEEDETDSSIYHVDEAMVEAARTSLTGGDYNTAVSTYQKLVSKGGGMMVLIGELELAAEEHPQQRDLRRLLGDAYMRNGQLQKALTIYRETLDQM